MKPITRTFEFNNEIITIEQTHGYGQYILRGLGTSVRCTDSEIWDWCTDDEDEEKHLAAKKAAFTRLKNAL